MMTKRQKKNHTHFCSASRESKGLGESSPRPVERGKETKMRGEMHKLLIIQQAYIIIITAHIPNGMTCHTHTLYGKPL